MTTKRKRQRRRITVEASPLTVTIDLKQFLSMLVAALLGMMFGGALPFRMTPVQPSPISIIPGGQPVQIDGKKESEPPRLKTDGNTSMPRSNTTVIVGRSEITLSNGY